MDNFIKYVLFMNLQSKESLKVGEEIYLSRTPGPIPEE